METSNGMELRTRRKRQSTECGSMWAEFLSLK